MKRSKGQVLIAFILLMPIVLLIFSLIIDLGLFSIEKRKIENTVKDTLVYGLNHIEDEDVTNYMKSLLLKNIDDISDENINIKKENDNISIKVVKKYKAKFRISKNLNIESSFTGTKKGDNIKIEEG